MYLSSIFPTVRVDYIFLVQDLLQEYAWKTFSRCIITLHVIRLKFDLHVIVNKVCTRKTAEKDSTISKVLVALSIVLSTLKYLAYNSRLAREELLRVISSRTGSSNQDYLLGSRNHWCEVRAEGERKGEGRVKRGETICTSLKGVGAASRSSNPSPSAASRREKQFTLPSGLRITFECWRGARALIPVNCQDNEILADFRARLFTLTRRDQFPFGEGIFFSPVIFVEHYLSNLRIYWIK